MGIWLAIFYNELRYYRRNWLLLGGIACTPLYLLWGFLQFMNDGIEVASYIMATGYLILACLLIGYIFGIMSIDDERKSKMDQYLLAIPGDRFRITAKLCAWFFFCLVYLLFCNLIIFLFISWVKSDFVYNYGEIFLYIVCYWGAALFGAYVIGMTVSLISSTRWIQIVVGIIVWFLSTTFISGWVKGYEIPEFVKTGLNWFVRTEREMNVMLNEFTGISISSFIISKHVSFILFTLCLLFLVVAVKNPRYYSTGSRIKYLSAGFIILLCFFLVLPHSFSVLDKTLASSYVNLRINEDRPFYEQSIVTEKQFNQELIANRYDIRLKHKGETIDYEATIDLETTSEKEPDAYVFTLYHGFEVLKATINDEVVNWSQNGDELIVQKPSSKTSPIQLRIQVSGQGGAKSLVTDNSFYLAEDFPWYPVPGKQTIAFVSPYFFEPQYISTMLPQAAEFNVEVLSSPRQAVFSNLSEIKNHKFEGKAHGLMLASSNLLKSYIDENEIVAPPDLPDQLDVSIRKMRETVDQLANWLDVEPAHIPQKIMLAPSYSTWKQDIIQLMPETIILNSETVFRQQSRLYNVEVIFYSYYWKNKLTGQQYQEKMRDSILLSELIGEQYGGYSSLLKDFSDQYTEYNEQDSLYVNANRIIEWMGTATQDEIQRLIKVVYHNLLENEIHDDVWEKSMKEVSGNGTAHTATNK